MRKRLNVTIINYRAPKLVFDCLETLKTELDPSKDIAVIVDNDSGDGSADAIEHGLSERGWNAWTMLVRSPKNGGFSWGNNVGIKSCEADFHLLLNSDTLVRPGAIGLLLRAMESDARTGLAGPRLEWPDGEGQISAFRYPSPITEFLNAAATGPIDSMLGRYRVATPLTDAPAHAEWVSFACVLIRREVIEQIGPMDEGYFMYSEDIDYCRTASKSGWKSMYWPDAHVVHLRGGSGPVKALTAARKRRPRYYYASRSRYYAKFYGLPGLWVANVLWHAGRAISFLREVFGKKERHTCEHEARDIWTNALNPMGPHSENKS
jgi:N-acetylglucosaminyl-diphospho-decaprenol L-rhamnosyltransferase